MVSWFFDIGEKGGRDGFLFVAMEIMNCVGRPIHNTVVILDRGLLGGIGMEKEVIWPMQAPHSECKQPVEMVRDDLHVEL